MGMTVYGTRATSEDGAYFRATIWGWPPLWECCEHFAPEITRLVESAYYNEGDGLDAERSRALAQVLEDAIRRGEMARYIAARDAWIAALPDELCDLCAGTGVRTDPVGVKYGMPNRITRSEDGSARVGWCNGCDGVGHRRPWATSYHLDLTAVLEFQRFLKDCGGFEIW